MIFKSTATFVFKTFAVLSIFGTLRGDDRYLLETFSVDRINFRIAFGGH